MSNTIKFKLSDCRALKRELGDDWQTVAVSLAHCSTGAPTSETDFDAGGYRFIHEDEIDRALRDELMSDTYVLGCFAPWLIGDILNVSYETIEALQEKEAFEEIADLILAKDGGINELAEEYARLDGYGPHFATYDGEERYLSQWVNAENAESWYVFKIG